MCPCWCWLKAGNTCWDITCCNNVKKLMSSHSWVTNIVIDLTAVISWLTNSISITIIGPLALPLMLKYLAIYPLYWFLQGTMMWAIFVLGHDCGHGSFSKSWILNDIMGNFLHSIILVTSPVILDWIPAFYLWDMQPIGSILPMEDVPPPPSQEHWKHRQGWDFLPREDEREGQEELVCALVWPWRCLVPLPHLWLWI